MSRRPFVITLDNGMLRLPTEGEAGPGPTGPTGRPPGPTPIALNAIVFHLIL